jgi:YVTN family beta-propeller protein
MKTINLKAFFLLSFLIFSEMAFAIPSVTSVSPLSGSTVGGNVVTIHGTGFTGTTSVRFGNKNAVPFNVINDTTLQAVAPINVPGAVEITVVASGTSVQNPPGDYYTYQGDWFAYVPDFGSANVFPINVQTQGIGTPILVGTQPNDVVFTPNGRIAIVVNSGSASITLIDAATQIPIISIPLASSFPILAVTPDGTQAAIVNFGSNNVTFLNLSTFTTTVVPVGNAPTSIAIIPSGQFGFVTNSGSSSLTRIDLQTFATMTIPTGPGSIPSFIEITPDGNTALVTDDSNDSVVLFNPRTLTFGTRLFGFSLHGANLFPEIAITPDGTTAWVTNTSSNTISSVINLNTASPTFGTNIMVGTSPNGIAITPDGAQAYVSNATTNNETVVTFATASTIDIPVGIEPTDPGITPDQAPVAYFSASAPVNNQIAFDASPSLSPTGTIATYAWDFGDGSPIVITTSPTISHTYTHSGAFNVTLTVTNTAGTSITQNFTGQVMLNNGGNSATLTQSITIPPPPPPPPPPPAPPSHFKNRRCADKFATQTEYINRLSWRASPDPTIVKYLLFRNGSLIATIPATSPLKFNDHDRPKNKVDTYTLIAVNASGMKSKPITIK